MLDAGLVPCHQLLLDYPAVQLNDQGLSYVSNGRDLGPAQCSTRMPAAGATWVRLMDPAGSLVALATPDATSAALHPSIVLLS